MDTLRKGENDTQSIIQATSDEGANENGFPAKVIFPSSITGIGKDVIISIDMNLVTKVEDDDVNIGSNPPKDSESNPIVDTEYELEDGTIISLIDNEPQYYMEDGQFYYIYETVDNVYYASKTANVIAEELFEVYDWQLIRECVGQRYVLGRGLCYIFETRDGEERYACETLDMVGLGFDDEVSDDNLVSLKYTEQKLVLGVGLCYIFEADNGTSWYGSWSGICDDGFDISLGYVITKCPEKKMIMGEGWCDVYIDDAGYMYAGDVTGDDWIMVDDSIFVTLKYPEKKFVESYGFVYIFEAEGGDLYCSRYIDASDEEYSYLWEWEIYSLVYDEKRIVLGYGLCYVLENCHTYRCILSSLELMNSIEGDNYYEVVSLKYEERKFVAGYGAGYVFESEDGGIFVAKTNDCLDGDAYSINLEYCCSLKYSEQLYVEDEGLFYILEDGYGSLYASNTKYPSEESVLFEIYEDTEYNENTGEYEPVLRKN